MNLKNVFLILILFSTMTIIPADAAYSWANNITVNMEGMNWEYTEQYSGNRSVIMKSAIDSELGDNDGFVAAWELLKADTLSRKNLFTSVSRKMDVRINDSSARISLCGVECGMAKELLGPVAKQEDVSNTYRVSYAFTEPLAGQDSRIWFQGEPKTYVAIRMPEGVDILSVEGVDNAAISRQGIIADVKGEFDLTGEAVVVYRVNGNSSKPQKQGFETDPVSPQIPEEPFSLDEVFPGSTDKLLERLKRSSKL